MLRRERVHQVLDLQNCIHHQIHLNQWIGRLRTWGGGTGDGTRVGVVNMRAVRSSVFGSLWIREVRFEETEWERYSEDVVRLS